MPDPRSKVTVGGGLLFPLSHVIAVLVFLCFFLTILSRYVLLQQVTQNVKCNKKNLTVSVIICNATPQHWTKTSSGAFEICAYTRPHIYANFRSNTQLTKACFKKKVKTDTAITSDSKNKSPPSTAAITPWAFRVESQHSNPTPLWQSGTQLFKDILQTTGHSITSELTLCGFHFLYIGTATISSTPLF